MKRILIPASGAVLATGLLAAGLAGSAQAASDVATDPMAKTAAAAQDIAGFWAESNGAALKAATASNVWDNSDISKLKSTGGYSADSKPGLVAPIGQEKKTTAKVQNVNLPKTIGKVFFVNAKGEKKWCSATSIQSAYRNLVSTAGHCVYDTAGNADTMSKWVFVPGYYQGKAPWGIYVGKQAFTHYDFDVYEDFDRDYAFVTVYNGIAGTIGKTTQVNKTEYTAATGTKYVEKKFFDVTDPKQAAEWAEGRSKYGDNGPFQKESVTSNPETVGKPASVTTAEQALKYYNTVGGIDGVKLTAVEVTKNTFDAAAKDSLENNAQFLAPSDEKPVSISKEEYEKLSAAKVAGNYLGDLTTKVVNGQIVDWYKQQFYIKRWTKSTTKELFWVETYFLVSNQLKDAGRLGDNVGGQGFAYNQPTGKYVRVFGYPAAPHPDGHKAYTGITPKWCYGKTTAKTVGSAAKKIEEHIALKCAMTEGADGGPWLLKYSNTKRLGYVNGVISTFNDQDGNDRVDYVSSPYFDGETAAVYNAAKGLWSGKIVG